MSLRRICYAALAVSGRLVVLVPLSGLNLMKKPEYAGSARADDLRPAAGETYDDTIPSTEAAGVSGITRKTAPVSARPRRQPVDASARLRPSVECEDAAAFQRCGVGRHEPAVHDAPAAGLLRGLRRRDDGRPGGRVIGARVGAGGRDEVRLIYSCVTSMCPSVRERVAHGKHSASVKTLANKQNSSSKVLARRDAPTGVQDVGRHRRGLIYRLLRPISAPAAQFAAGEPQRC